MPATFAALRQRNYSLFYAGQVLSLTGTWMERIALSQLTYDLTGGDARWLGYIGFIPVVPALLLSLPAGALADRVQPRRVVVATQSLMMLGAAAMAAVVLAGAARPWHVALYTLWSSSAFAVDAAARQALLTDLVPKDLVTNAVALNASMFNASRFFGGAAFTAVVHHTTWGKGGCLALNALSFLFVIAGLLAMRMEPRAPVSHERRGGLLDGVRFARRTPEIRAALCVVIVLSMFGFQVSHLLPVYADKVWRVGEEGFGWLSAAVGAGSLVGSLTLATRSRSVHRGKLVLAYAMLAPVVLALFASGGPFWLALLLVAAGGFFMNQAQAAVASILQLGAASEMRGRVMALFTLAVLSSFPIGGLIGGFAADAFGVQATTLADAVIIAVAVIAIRVTHPKLQEAA